MKVIAYPRTEKGSGASRRLRKSGMAPGIVYGGNSAPMNIKLDHNALFYALKREAFHSSILDLEVEGKTQQVLLRDYQMHAFKPVVLHVDFQRVNANQPITVKVPLHFENEENAPAVKISSGTIQHFVTELEITCLPRDLPEYIAVNMETIDIGQTIYLSDIKLPSGVLATTQDVSMPIANAIATASHEEAGKTSALSDTKE